MIFALIVSVLLSWLDRVEGSEPGAGAGGEVDVVVLSKVRWKGVEALEPPEGRGS